MSKRILVDGKFYRLRRGVLVQIPDEWVGKIPTDRTIRNRQSKMTGKLKRATKWRRNTPRHGSGPMFVEYLDKRILVD